MAFLGQASRLFRLQGVKLGAASIPMETKLPLFQRIVPWWARWTWAFLACDIFMTGSAIELTWNHWSRPVDDIDSSDKTSLVAKSPQSTQYTMRPIWQRAGLCVAHMGFGVGIAVALLVTQTRFVRTLAIVPASCLPKKAAASEGPHVFLQCAHNFKKNGLLFPLNGCSLHKGRNETEMIFRTAGAHGHWHISLENALVNGRLATPTEARQSILQAWGGKYTSHKEPKSTVDSRWKSGPIRRLAQ